MKTCTKCGIAKGAEEFRRKSELSHGLSPACRDCTAEYDRRYRQANRARIAAYNRTKPRRTAEDRRSVEWQRRHPAQTAARHAVKRALQAGKLTKQPCFVCGNDAEAHHASYAKEMRLSVTWLCRAHHAEVHRKRGR
jgi:hypothetical protein